MKILPKVFLSSVLLLAYTALAQAECMATKEFRKDKSFKGCLTNVDGKEHFSDAKGITELGCETFCSALNSSNKESGGNEIDDLYSPSAEDRKDNGLK